MSELERIPTHVAIIPDGNRRWAHAQGLEPVQGHEQGAQNTRELAVHAADRGVRYLSLWGMSRENFQKRNTGEITGLLRIFREEFAQLAESEEVHSRNVRIHAFGSWRDVFPGPVVSNIERAMEATREYADYHLNFFLAYSGTDEMVEAVRAIAAEQPDVITGETIKSHLLTKDIPPVDLMVRTGGDPHLSAGFLMWDMADAQLYFPDVYYPAFTTDRFDEALAEYAARERRKGR